MKGKILTLFIGILIGAIIATIGFILYTKINEKNSTNGNQMMMEKFNMQGEFPDGNMEKRKRDKQNSSNENNTEMPNITNQLNNEDDQPPELPDGKIQNGEVPNGTPPELPDGKKQNGEATNNGQI